MTQEATIKTIYCGIIGALLMYVGDLLLYGDITNTDISPKGIVAVMCTMKESRLITGGFLGPLAGVFYCMGFYGVSRMVRQKHPLLRWVIFISFCLAMVYGGAYHSHYPQLAFSSLEIEAATRIANYVQLLTMGAVIPMALGSVVFLFAVLFGYTDCKKILALFSPLPLILLSFPLQSLSPPWLTLIAGGWNNLLFILFFLACIRFMHKDSQLVQKSAGETSLDSLTKGNSGLILSVNCSEMVKERLAALGLMQGSQIFLLRTGKVMVVECRGTFIAIAEKIAKQILVGQGAK